MNSPPVIVVLAAGQGRRFEDDGHKLSQTFGVRTVLGQTVMHAIQSGLPMVVVTTDGLLACVSDMVAGRDVVLMPQAARDRRTAVGMGHSIAAGVASRPNASGWLMLPGDMPLVKPETLREVASALAVHPVAYAQHQGRRGHPVGFSSELFSDLVHLAGDEGAKRLVARYPSQAVEVPDSGVLQDVDTREDLQALRAQWLLNSAAMP